MNSKICLFVCVVSLFTSACFAEVLSTYNLLWQTAKNEDINSCTIGLCVVEDGSIRAELFNTIISPADKGRIFTANLDTPGFSDFVSYITNGTNGYIGIDLKSLKGTQVGNGFLQSDVFGKPSTGISDLKGRSIDLITLKVNDFVLDHFCGVWWEDGIGTMVTGDFQFSASAPEPGTIVLLLTALLVMPIIWLRKKHHILH